VTGVSPDPRSSSCASHPDTILSPINSLAEGAEGGGRKPSSHPAALAANGWAPLYFGATCNVSTV
jgi:hypothetical protein